METRQKQSSRHSSHDDEPDGLLYMVSEQAPVRRFLKKHERKLWWVHTSYALALGISVVVFANKGFAHARWLIASLGAVWLLLVLFFRFFGSGAREQRFATAEKKSRIGFLVMNYVLKNLYQGMLFFMLPFYWKSATVDSPNISFVVLIGLCALLSTLDLVFDNVLMRSKVVASVFYAVTLLGCVNLVIPAIVPDTRTIYSLLIAAAISALAFALIHIPVAALRNRLHAALLAVAVASSVTGVYFARRFIPPVPMHLSAGAVGPAVLPDGRLAMEVTTLHASVITELLAVTDIVVPGGKGDKLVHVWRRGGNAVHTTPEETSRVEGEAGAIRLRSGLKGGSLPAQLTGKWSVDVVTEDGRLVGRTNFTVTE